MSTGFKNQGLLVKVPDIRAEITRRTVREKIGDKLISLIVSGILQVGDELPSERELASFLSVSRETVRGAIQTLAAKGIVEVSQGARTRVIRSDIDASRHGIVGPWSINSYDLESVHQARLLVECAIVAEAAERIDDEALCRLGSSLAAQKETMGDPVRFLICDREFHTAIYRCAANQLLAEFVIGLYAYMLEHRRAAISRPGAIQKSYEDHLAIVGALYRRDPGAVVAAFTEHIDRIYVTTISIMAEREGSSRQ